MILGLLLLFADVELEPRSLQGMTGVLRIELAREPEGIGLAGVWLHLTVTGLPTAQLDGPRLEDPLDAWRERWRLSSWTAEGTIVRSVYLVQRKPGPAPLPDVVLRVRTAPDAPWHEWAWYEPLATSKPVAPVEKTSMPPPPAWVMWPWVVAAGLLAAFVAIWWWQRWQRKPSKHLSPEQRFLQRLSQADDKEVFVLLHKYLNESFSLSCDHLTVHELQHLLVDWPVDLRSELLLLLEQAERVRYSPAAAAINHTRLHRWIEESGRFRDFRQRRQSV